MEESKYKGEAYVDDVKMADAMVLQLLIGNNLAIKLDKSN